jgi:hypothetical protein
MYQSSSYWVDVVFTECQRRFGSADRRDDGTATGATVSGSAVTVGDGNRQRRVVGVQFKLDSEPGRRSDATIASRGMRRPPPAAVT